MGGGGGAYEGRDEVLIPEKMLQDRSAVPIEHVYEVMRRRLIIAALTVLVLGGIAYLVLLPAHQLGVRIPFWP